MGEGSGGHGHNPLTGSGAAQRLRFHRRCGRQPGAPAPRAAGHCTTSTPRTRASWASTRGTSSRSCAASTTTGSRAAWMAARACSPSTTSRWSCPCPDPPASCCCCRLSPPLVSETGGGLPPWLRCPPVLSAPLRSASLICRVGPIGILLNLVILGLFIVFRPTYFTFNHVGGPVLSVKL